LPDVFRAAPGNTGTTGFGRSSHLIGDEVGILFIGGYSNPDDNVVVFQFLKIEKMINKIQMKFWGTFFTDRGSF
jgi:hypothetical protein